MATEKTIILITGANGGIGFELVSQLLSDPSKHVLLGSRSIEKGEAAVRDLLSREQPGTVELLQLDVASDDSITAAAKTVGTKHGRLDALVNNAAIGSLSVPGSPADQMAQCFQTNATGPFLMVEAFAPLLEKSKSTPRIINISSGGGSIGRRLDPTAQPRFGMWGIAYCASKAAMNLLTAAQSVVYGEKCKVFAFSPGFVVSNLGPHNKAENGAQPTDVGTAPIVKILNGERDAEHAKFLTATGQYPW